MTKYQAVSWVTRPQPHAVAFDMPEAQFSNGGNVCTFETTLHTFGFAEPSLQTVGAIVHEIDVRDGRYPCPEVTGSAAILNGWLQIGLSHAARETHGSALFEGLNSVLSALRHAAPV